MSEKRTLINRGQYLLHYKNEPFLNSLFINPKMLREDEIFIKSFLKSGETYVDVGANIGTTTLCSAKVVGPTGRVIAFEPHAETFLLLGKNVNLNKLQNITLHNKAVGDREKQLFITNEFASDINYLVDKGELAVQVNTLDSFLKSYKRINFLKIDVEGFEEAVFRGGDETLTKTDVILFESSKSQYGRYGYSFKNIFNILKSKNFYVYRLTFSPKEILFKEVSDGEYFSDNLENICASKVKQSESLTI